MGVGDDLHLHVAGVLDQLFEVDVILAEGSGSLAFGNGDFLGELVGIIDASHAAPTTAPAGLDHDGQTDFLTGCIGGGVAIGQGVCRGNCRHVRGFCELARSDLVPQIDQGLGARTDKGDPGGVRRCGQLRGFREKTIARVDGISAGELRDADDFLDREVGRNRLHPHPDFVGLIRLEAVQGEAVFVGVNGDRLDAQLCCATKHADRDFRAVGNEQLADGLGRRSAGGHGAGPLRR